MMGFIIALVVLDEQSVIIITWLGRPCSLPVNLKV